MRSWVVSARVVGARSIVCASAALGLHCTLLVGAHDQAVAAALPSSLVNTIDTSRWSPASPDPSGITYDSLSQRLLVADGEVDEMSIYKGANVFEATLAGNVVKTTNTLAFSHEPVGAALDSGGRLFVSDDDQRKVFQVALGSNGSFDSADSTTSFGTSSFGSADPEGVAYDRAGNRLFIAAGEGSEIYRISPVDGIFGNGNDQVQHFDTALLGITDPETVEFNPDTGTVFTIGTPGKKIVETTTAGALVSELDTSYLPLVHPAGMAYAPRSTDPAKNSIYIADRKVDNDNHPSENDGAIYEVAPEPAGVGGATPPPSGDVRVAAGSGDAEEGGSGAVGLSSSDLEFVTDGSLVQTVGLRFPGLGVPAGAAVTKAYIQFVADESQSEATTLTVRAQAADDAQAFTTAGFDVSSRPRTGASLSWSPGAWTAGDAGAAQRSPDLSGLVQEVVDRSGWAAGNALAFVVTGSGHRTAVSFDGSASKAALLHVEYQQAPTNRAPSVDAGPGQVISLPGGAALDGTVTDDGQPSSTPSTTWSKVSGPGTVTFASPGAVDTEAALPAPGPHVLRLTADDGALTASDDLTIVADTTSPLAELRVAAGSGDAEEGGSGAVGLSSSDLEFVTDGSLVQTVGLRFPGLGVPAGAAVTKAYIQFVADESQSEATTLTVRAQAADDAQAFTTAGFDVSSRPRTGASLSWSPGAWTAGDAGAAQRSPDLSGLVQEVVDRSGWAAGNALAFVVTGSGHRTAVSFDGSASKAALLHLEYR